MTTIAGLAVFFLLVRAFCIRVYHKRNSHLSKELKGKLVVVTGGTSGIGRETVVDLFMQGATVVFNGRKSERIASIIVARLL